MTTVKTPPLPVIIEQEHRFFRARPEFFEYWDERGRFSDAVSEWILESELTPDQYSARKIKLVVHDNGHSLWRRYYASLAERVTMVQPDGAVGFLVHDILELPLQRYSDENPEQRVYAIEYFLK